MSYAKMLEQLEDKFYGELEEDREKIMSEIETLFQQSRSLGIDEYNDFSDNVMTKFGGIFIPNVFWVELGRFVDNNEERGNIFKLIKAFCESNFEDEEKRKLKLLLITYFASEKEFEINKIQSLIVDKAHPDIQDYFRKLKNFVEKNTTSVSTYIEKFELLKDKDPDFELLRMPLMKLRETLVEA